MFVKIAARASESDETYDMVAKCAEQLAEAVEEHLKNRTDPDPDPDMGNSSVSQGIYCTTNCIEFCIRLTFQFIVAGPLIDSSRVSKHNDGLEMPKGMKVKEKTVKGSKRPVGGFEKATSKKKKNTNDIVHLEPRGPSTV